MLPQCGCVVSLVARFPETAWGIFAPMRETTAEGAAKTAAPEVRGAVKEPDDSEFPLLQKRFAKALTDRSRFARILLSNSPAFRILMVGSSISMFGSRISTVAFPMLVLHLNNSPFVTGLVAFAAIAPSALAYIPAGVLVDRWNPRRVMLASELLRGLVIASVVLSLIIFGLHISIWFLMLAMVAEEILEIFFMLADRRYLSGLMKAENKGSRQAYVEVRSHAAVLAGRPIGPFLFAIQPFLPFLADALSFLFSVCSLVVVRRNNEPARELQRVPRKQLFRDVGQGFSLLKKDRRAFLTIILMAATSLVGQALILMFLSEAHSKELSTVAIGVVLAASGVGGAVGAVVSRFLPDAIRRFWLPIQMVAWAIALGSLVIVGGLSVSCSAIAMLVLGLTGAIGNIEFGTYIVSNVAEDMIAKVIGIGQMMAIGACALGPVLGGATVERYGSQGAVTILLIIVLLLALLSLLAPEVAEKLAEIYHSISHASPFARPSAASSVEMATDSSGRSGVNRIDPPSEIFAFTPCCQGLKLHTKDQVFWVCTVVSLASEIVDHSR
jgi:MFS family permease